MNTSIATSKITQVILAALICMGCGVSSCTPHRANGLAALKHTAKVSDFIKEVRASNMLYYIVWLLFEVQWWGNIREYNAETLKEIVTILMPMYDSLHEVNPKYIAAVQNEKHSSLICLLNLIMKDPSKIRKLEFLRHTINAMNYNISQADKSEYNPVKSYITDIKQLSEELHKTSAQDSIDNALHTTLSKEHYHKDSVSTENIKQEMQNIATKVETKEKLEACSKAYWLWRRSSDNAMRDLISKIPLSISERTPQGLIEELPQTPTKREASSSESTTSPKSSIGSAASPAVALTPTAVVNAEQTSEIPALSVDKEKSEAKWQWNAALQEALCGVAGRCKQQ
jgi:hypothetical protein